MIGSYAGIFRDFEVWEGNLVAGLNGYDEDGHLLALGDFSSLSMFDILGSKALIKENGLFVGSAGILLEGSGGAFATSRSTSAVPEPSSILLLTMAGLGGLLKRRSRNSAT